MSKNTFSSTNWFKDSDAFFMNEFSFAKTNAAFIETNAYGEINFHSDYEKTVLDDIIKNRNSFYKSFPDCRVNTETAPKFKILANMIKDQDFDPEFIDQTSNPGFMKDGHFSTFVGKAFKYKYDEPEKTIAMMLDIIDIASVAHQAAKFYYFEDMDGNNPIRTRCREFLDSLPAFEEAVGCIIASDPVYYNTHPEDKDMMACIAVALNTSDATFLNNLPMANAEVNRIASEFPDEYCKRVAEVGLHLSQYSNIKDAEEIEDEQDKRLFKKYVTKNLSISKDKYDAFIFTPGVTNEEFDEFVDIVLRLLVVDDVVGNFGPYRSFNGFLNMMRHSGVDFMSFSDSKKLLILGDYFKSFETADIFFMGDIQEFLKTVPDEITALTKVLSNNPKPTKTSDNDNTRTPEVRMFRINTETGAREEVGIDNLSKMGLPSALTSMIESLVNPDNAGMWGDIAAMCTDKRFDDYDPDLEDIDDDEEDDDDDWDDYYEEEHDYDDDDEEHDDDDEDDDNE